LRFTVRSVLAGLALGAVLAVAEEQQEDRAGDEERGAPWENVMPAGAQLRSGTPRAAVIRRLGQPHGVGAGSKRSCVYYPTVDQPATAWELCFRRGRLDSGSTVIRR
jgi:hypothetical protein